MIWNVALDSHRQRHRSLIPDDSIGEDGGRGDRLVWHERTLEAGGIGTEPRVPTMP